MRYNLKIVIAVAVVAVATVVACKKDQKGVEGGQAAGLTEPPCTTIIDTVTFSPNTIINTTMTLSASTLYILDGKTWVANGGKLVIPAGTVFKGVKKTVAADASALIVTTTGSIEASGTASCPITFTSVSDSVNGAPQPGDWGGVVILGEAPTNQGTDQIEGITSAPAGVSYTYGGNLPNDNSGWLRYVRILYAGALVATDNELNGLTLGSVGCGTELNHIEVFKGADDGFEFFGGTVNGTYLLSISNNDDQFDFDQGYRGNLQYIVAILASNVTYASANTNGIESDNEETGACAALTPTTRPVISHMTIAGPANCTVSTANAILNGARFRRASRFVIENSIIYNFPTGVRVENICSPNAVLDTCGTDTTKSYFYNNVVFGCTANFNGMTAATQTVANANSIRVNNPTNYAGFFSAVNGLKPIVNTKADTARYCGLVPVNCSFAYNTTTTVKGGAVDASGNYWLDDSWIIK